MQLQNRAICSWLCSTTAPHLTVSTRYLSNVRFGSKADVTLVNFDVRFTPESRHRSARGQCPLWASSGLMHRSKQHHFSITSSARANSVWGTPRFILEINIREHLSVVVADKETIWLGSGVARLASNRPMRRV